MEVGRPDRSCQDDDLLALNVPCSATSGVDVRAGLAHRGQSPAVIGHVEDTGHRFVTGTEMDPTFGTFNFVLIILHVWGIKSPTQEI